jgi:ankyrin repeat protein
MAHEKGTAMSANSADDWRLLYANVFGSPTIERAEKEMAENGWTLLHWAGSKGASQSQLEQIAQLGGDKEARDKLGRTPLHIAAALGHAAAVGAMLRLGADKEAQSSEGQRPLHLGAGMDSLPAVEALLHAGAEKEARDINGLTPLHWAASEGAASTAEALLRAGANKDAKSNDANSPLHLAVRKGHLLVTSLLLQAGVSQEANKSGSTPLKIAVVFGSAPVVQTLLRNGVTASALPEAIRLAEMSLGDGPLQKREDRKSILNMLRSYRPKAGPHNMDETAADKHTSFLKRIFGR